MRWVTSFTDPWLSFSEFGPVGRQLKGMLLGYCGSPGGHTASADHIQLAQVVGDFFLSFFLSSSPFFYPPSYSQVTAALLSR